MHVLACVSRLAANSPRFRSELGFASQSAHRPLVCNHRSLFFASLRCRCRRTGIARSAMMAYLEERTSLHGVGLERCSEGLACRRVIGRESLLVDLDAQSPRWSYGCLLWRLEYFECRPSLFDCVLVPRVISFYCWQHRLPQWLSRHCTSANLLRPNPSSASFPCKMHYFLGFVKY